MNEESIWTKEAISVNDEFFGLVHRTGMSVIKLSQITSAPFKEMLQWGEEKPAPEYALTALKKFLGVE